jgi:diaminopropionate ammonia-lyase
VLTTLLDRIWIAETPRQAVTAAVGDAPLRFHRRLPGYVPSPLRDLPQLARRLAVGRVVVKLESDRFGLPAFKALGAFYAAYSALCDLLGGEPAWRTISDLRAALAPLRPLTLLAATDGNHGRAVARFAAICGLQARIFVPVDMAPARMAAIMAEGAVVEVVPGSYDDAVETAARAADARRIVISDTAWPGYERIPQAVIDGYSTMFQEVDQQLAGRPDLVMVPVGVGALAAAAARHYRDPAVRLVSVEPHTAACLLNSLQAGEITAVPGPHPSIMAGLNCGLPSSIAWPVLQQRMDAALAVTDEAARLAMRELASAHIVAGETGAAALGGLLALTPELRRRLDLGPAATVLILMTEGATDPDNYAQIVGLSAEAVAAG